MANNPPTPVDKFFQHKWQADGIDVPQRPKTNVVGGGIVFTDDPVNNATTATVVGAGGGGGQDDATVANGLNSNVPTSAKQVLRLKGPTGPFKVGGFTPPSSPSAQLMLLVVNTTPQAMTFVPEDTSSTPGWRIDTQSGAPVTLPSRKGSALFIYDLTTSRWVLQNMGLLYPASLKGRDTTVLADGVELTDGAMVAGSPNLHSPGATFSVADEGKIIAVRGAGVSGAVLATTIKTFTDATHVVLNANASTSTASVNGPAADGHIASGSNVFTSSAGVFAAGDVNKPISIAGAGAAGGALVTQIAQVVGATEVLLGLAASTTVTTAAYSYGGGVRFAYGTDDTAAVLATAAAAAAEGGLSAVCELPPGNVMVSGLDLSGFSGLTLAGSSVGGQAVTNPTRLILAAASPFCVKLAQSLQMKLERLWIDGYQLASSKTVLLSPLCSTLIVDRCLISGAKPHVADLIGPDGSLEVDNIRVRHFALFQDPQLLGTTARARSAAYVDFNAQAFNMHLEHGGIFDTDYGVFNQSGAWDIRHVQIFGQSVGFALIYLEAAQPFEVVDVYTERNDGAGGTMLANEASVAFIAFGNGFAVNGDAPVHVRKAIINGKNPINFNGKQPLALEACRLGGNVNLLKATPPAGGPPIGIYRVWSSKTVFTDPSVGFTGDLSMLDQVGTDGNLSNDSGHGGYGTNNRNVTRFGAGLEAAGAFVVSGSEAQHVTEIETIAYLAATTFGNTAQLVGDWDAAKGITTSGGNVTQWVDQRQGFALTDAATGVPPAYVAPGGGAKPYVGYTSGTNQALGGAAFGIGITNPFEILAIIRDDQTGFQLVDTANAYTGVNTGGAGALQPHGTALFNATEPGGGPQDLVTDVVFNGAASKVSYNGAADTTGDTGVIGLGPNLTIGNQHGAAPGASWGGRIYRMLFLNAALSATYRHQLQAQLCWQYGTVFSGTATQVAYPVDSMVDAYGNTVPDRVVASKCASGLIATLPAPTPGRAITFVDETGLGGSVAPITVVQHGSETVNGTTSVTMTTSWGALTVRSPDGVNWVAEQAGGGGGSDVLASVSTPAGVTVADGSVGVVATATIVAPVSGRIEIVASLGPGGSTSLTTANLLLAWAAHGSTFPTGFTTVDASAMTTLGPTPYGGVNGIVFGLTPGASYDIVTAIGPSGDNYHTTGATNANGGIIVRAG